MPASAKVAVHVLLVAMQLLLVLLDVSTKRLCRRAVAFPHFLFQLTLVVANVALLVADLRLMLVDIAIEVTNFALLVVGDGRERHTMRRDAGAPEKQACGSIHRVTLQSGRVTETRALMFEHFADRASAVFSRNSTRVDLRVPPCRARRPASCE